MNNRRSCLIFFLMFIFFGFTKIAFAANVVLPSTFDKDSTYDIYFEAGYDSEKFIIKGVEIVGFQEIGGKTFLVIKAGGFNLKEDNGFVLFDSVAAILPNWQFKVERLPGRYIHNK